MNTLLFTLSLSLGVLVGVLILYRRAERARAKRSVEPPNSTFQSRYVQELRSWERWEKMDLSRLHEINRAEVEKLLSKVRRASVRVLTVQERDFLERMADAHDRVAGKEFRGGAGGARPSPASGMP